MPRRPDSTPTEAKALKGIHRYVARYVAELEGLEGRSVVDIPAGDGRTSRLFQARGARVRAYDLYPEFFEVEDVRCEYADLTEPLPIESETADYVVCQEGIEHLSDQLAPLREFSRILKPGGRLVLTTPSVSNLRARFSMLLNENNNWRKPAASEIQSLWFTEDGSDRLFYGHIFLIPAQRLRTLAALSGLELEEIRATKLNLPSIAIGLLIAPLFVVMNLLGLVLAHRRHRHVDREVRRRVLGEQLRINCDPRILFCRHLFWVLRKVRTPSENLAYLKKLTRAGN